jgi:hopanoid C-3 methylase
MKILLINPPNCGRSIPEERFGIGSIKQIFKGEPLALETLAGNLPEHDVRIADLKVEPDALEENLCSFRPELVGITAMTCEANTAVRLARRVREHADIPVVVGGIHASNDPGFFNVEGIHYVVVGLGKASFRELVQRLAAGEEPADIPGIARTNPDGPFVFARRDFSTADLAEDRPPAYHLVERYRANYRLDSLGVNMGFVVSSWGCPHSCSFCCVAALTGGKSFPCSADAVLRDVGLLGDIPVIRLVDANTFQDAEKSLDLCHAIAAKGIRKHFFADVRTDTVVRHPDVLREWRQAGLRAVVIGFEDFTDARLRGMRKGLTADVHRKAIEILHEIGVSIVGDFIVSSDFEERDFENLGEFIAETRIELPILSILTPLPGTPLYASMQNKIVNRNLDYYTLTNAVAPTRLPEEEFYGRYAALTQRFHAKPAL